MVAVVMRPLQTLPVHPLRPEGSREAFPDPRDVISPGSRAPRLNWLKGLWRWRRLVLPGSVM